MSPAPAYLITHTMSFPRVSGDEPPDMPGVNEQTVFSPRERG